MNKTTEALKLAEEALYAELESDTCEEFAEAAEKCHKALAAIREALAEPEITTPDVCGEVCARAKLCYGCGKAFDEALADHIAASGKLIAEPVKQEPVAHYKDAPHTIYLQTGCDDPEDCDCSFNEWGDTTWCADQIHDTDIPYIRADYAAPVSAKREWVELTDDEEYELAKQSA